MARAKRIMRAYICACGEFTVNISSKVHDKLKADYMKENAVPQYDMFDGAIDEIKQMIVNDSLTRFLFSAEYLTLLRADLESDASSEASGKRGSGRSFFSKMSSASQSELSVN
jgi:hypothetical protein